MFKYIKVFFLLTFVTLKDFLGEISLKLFFIIRQDLLKRNFTIIYFIITLKSITKNNFTLSNSNKNYSLKFTFDIFTPNKIYYFKNNFSKNNSFNRSS